jgi:predicted negative regulator of RcsB-dependent stress response
MSKQPQDSDKPLPPEAFNADSELPPDADIEERFNDFWKRNGPGIFGGIALGALIVVGIQSYQYVQDRREQDIRAAFAAAGDPAGKLEFANTHGEHQLAALARLQVADARYETGEFAEAAELYAGAARGFDDPVLVSRALLGQGMSLLRAGSTDSGRALLETVALDSASLDQTRAEAAYHAAVSFWEAGELERVDEMTQLILELEAPFWVFRANSLRDRLQLVAASE